MLSRTLTPKSPLINTEITPDSRHASKELNKLMMDFRKDGNNDQINTMATLLHRIVSLEPEENDVTREQLLTVIGFVC